VLWACKSSPTASLPGLTSSPFPLLPSADDAAADDGSQGGAGDDSEDDYDHGDSFLADSPGARPRGHRRSRAHNGSGRYAIAAAFNPLTDLPQPQAAIQPGSTDMDSGRRYLSYTSLGAITLRSESDHNVVEVAFHDTARARRRVPLLSDFFGFRLGALGERGAFYASHSSIDAPSTLVYRPFESWAPNADWSMGLPAGEEAECIATGDSFCAVATSTRNLRLFSLGGLQTGILALAGAPVALAACGHTLAVAWHSAPPTPSGDQSICFTVYDTAEQRLVSQGSLALSPGATLAWLGFSEDGMLSTYDSEGVLRLRTPSFGGAWMPAFSAAAERKGSEHFWVFAVSVAAKEVQCIVCANSPEPTVPSGLARPVVTAAPLRINVVPHDETLAPLEADVLRQALLIAHLGAREADPDAADMATLQAAQVESDRASLRLFTRLAQTDRLVRALEVASGMQTAVGLEGARKIANHQRLSALAKQVAALIEQRAAMEAEAAEAEYMNQLNTRDVYGGAVAVREPAPAVHMGPRVAAVAGEPAGSPAAHGSGDDGEAEDDSKVENGPPNRTPVAEKDGENGAAPKRKAPVGNPFARKKSTKA